MARVSDLPQLVRTVCEQPAPIRRTNDKICKGENFIFYIFNLEFILHTKYFYLKFPMLRGFFYMLRGFQTLFKVK